LEEKLHVGAHSRDGGGSAARHALLVQIRPIFRQHLEKESYLDGSLGVGYRLYLDRFGEIEQKQGREKGIIISNLNHKIWKKNFKH
jgi:hypothetical protein